MEMLDPPDIKWALRTGYPPWNQPSDDEYTEDDEYSEDEEEEDD